MKIRPLNPFGDSLDSMAGSRSRKLLHGDTARGRGITHEELMAQIRRQNAAVAKNAAAARRESREARKQR